MTIAVDLGRKATKQTTHSSNSTSIVDMGFLAVRRLVLKAFLIMI